MKIEFEKALKHNEVTEEMRTNHFTNTGEYSTDEVILEWYNKDKSEMQPPFEGEIKGFDDKYDLLVYKYSDLVDRYADLSDKYIELLLSKNKCG